MKSLIFLLALVSMMVFDTAAAAGPCCATADDQKEVVIYSGRHPSYILAALESFEQETGIKVRLNSGDAAVYAHRIIEEGDRPQADIFLANDAAVMENLRLQGLLTPITSAGIELIPSDFRAEDISWTGLSARARILMYNPELISKEDMPESLLDLADPKYRGQFAITRAGNASMIAHITALRAELGDETTANWIEKVLANEPKITRGHFHIRQMVGAGEIKFGLVNNYYYHQQLEEEQGNNVAAIYPDQQEGAMGVFVNISGMALVKGGPNSAHARKLADFFLEPQQQRMFAWVSKETPLLADIEAIEQATRIDEFRRMRIHLSKLGPLWAETIELMKQAGYTD